VLARLDDLPGVLRSRAECSGHYFLVELRDGATQGVVEGVVGILGDDAHLLASEEAEAQYDARRRGEPWVTAQEARSLSFMEGRMLGLRVSAAVGTEAKLATKERERLAEDVREEMFCYVERVYAGLAPAGRFFEAWPQIAERIVKRCGRWLDDEHARKLAPILIEHFDPQESRR
jgi:hypothetical protein